MESITVLADRYVKEALADNDASHDYWHIHRVRNMALRLAREEGIPESNMELVELTALLHDIGDWKYTPTDGTPKADPGEFLRSHNYDRTNEILDIINRMGFKEELANGGSGTVSPEMAVVQDADRLDAIGAIGIARCLTFGGYFKRSMFDPEVPPRENLTKDAYMKSAKQTTINHFHEKLLKLKDMMKSESGRKVAERRHEVMLDWLEAFYAEWDGRD